MKQPPVSIIIPSRNESEDIAATLDACLAIDYEPKEIIVVDDSTDDTTEIVVGYAEHGVRLVHRQKNENGCCGARNLGMQEATGDILVLFNADDLPKPDYLKRLLPHYVDGADYVVVASTVTNQEVRWGEYVVAAEGVQPCLDPEWSEGFSCRRLAAKQVGYIPGNFPVPFCRDYMLGTSLRAAGFKKHVDLSIPVHHVVPGSLAGFWRNRVWRGSFAAPHAYYFRHMSFGRTILRETLKAARTTLKYLLVIPAMWEALRLAKHTTRGSREVFRMLTAMFVADAATVVGGILGLARLWKALP